MASEPEPKGAVVGDFEVVRALANEGSGVVYAVKARATGEPRALKVFPPQVAVIGGGTAIPRGVATAQKIDDEHLVKVLRAGVDVARGAPWVAMELLAGEDLGTHVVREGPFERAEAEFVLSQVFVAIAAAHRAGAVHGDLKPSDVFITSAATVKVLDLGVSRELASWKHAHGLRKGLAKSFLAPEVLAGEEARATADVFSLGQLVYFTMVGRPFKEGDARASGQGAAFDRWVERAVSHDPSKRFADAGAAHEAFLAALRDVGVVEERKPALGTMTATSFANVFSSRRAGRGDDLPPTERADGLTTQSDPPPAPPAAPLPPISRPDFDAAPIKETLNSGGPVRKEVVPPRNSDTREQLALAAVPLPGRKNVPTPAPKSAEAEVPPVFRDPRVLALLAIIAVIAAAAIVLLRRR